MEWSEAQLKYVQRVDLQCDNGWTSTGTSSPCHKIDSALILPPLYSAPLGCRWNSPIILRGPVTSSNFGYSISRKWVYIQIYLVSAHISSSRRQCVWPGEHADDDLNVAGVGTGDQITGTHSCNIQFNVSGSTLNDVVIDHQWIRACFSNTDNIVCPQSLCQHTCRCDKGMLSSAQRGNIVTNHFPRPGKVLCQINCPRIPKNVSHSWTIYDTIIELSQTHASITVSERCICMLTSFTYVC